MIDFLLFWFLFIFVLAIIQGQLEEAESMFNSMKMADCYPDVVTYTAMLHAYNAAGEIVCYSVDMIGC